MNYRHRAFHILAISFLLILVSFKSTQENFPEKVDWDTHYLAKPDTNSAFAASTVTNWQYSYNAKTSGNNLHIDFKFVAGVVPEKSWVKHDRIRTRKSSRILLNHEQGHVNINYLLLKESEIVIRNQKYTIRNYKKLIQATANKIGKKYSELQEKYDSETKHGADELAQAHWDYFTNSEIEKFK